MEGSGSRGLGRKDAASFPGMIPFAVNSALSPSEKSSL